MLLSFSSTCRKVMNLNVVPAFVVVFRFPITGLQTLILFSGCGIIFTREWWVSSAVLQSTVSVGFGLRQSRWKRLLTHFLTPVSAPLYPSTLFSLQSLALIDRAHTLRSACGGIRKRQQRRFWATHVNRKCSLRSRRLKVVGTRKNRRARRRHAREEGARRVSPSRAPVLSFTRYFQAPVTQATGSEDFSLLPCLDSTKFILLSVFTVCSKIWAKILPQNASLCLNLIMISTVPLMQCDIFLWPRQVSHNPVCLGIHSPLCCQ